MTSTTTSAAANPLANEAQAQNITGEELQFRINRSLLKKGERQIAGVHYGFKCKVAGRVGDGTFKSKKGRKR